MALPMTLIIIAGEIDLSVESMAGLASAVLGFLWAAGVPLDGRHPGRARRRRARRPAERTARRPRRSAVARRDPRDARPLPRPRPDRARTARRQRLPAGVHRARLRPRARDADPVAVRHLRRAGHRARRSCSTGRGSAARSTRSARTPARPASPACGSRGSKVGLFVLSGLDRRARRHHPDRRGCRAPAPTPAQGMTLTVVTVVLLGGVNIFGGLGHDPGRRPRGPRRWRSCRTPSGSPA